MVPDTSLIENSQVKFLQVLIFFLFFFFIFFLLGEGVEIY
jgi:hypothetical protein